jgi:hypothetical protein
MREAEVRALLRVALCLAASPLALLSLGRPAMAQAMAPSAASVPPRPFNWSVKWDDGVDAPSLVSAVFSPDLAFTSVTPAGGAWNSTETWVEGGGGTVDRLRMAAGSATPSVPGAPLWLPVGAETFDISYTRGWPSALSLQSGDYAMDVTPHAGLGVTSAGGSAEAGATVRFGAAEALQRLGVAPGGLFGQQGRWYFYAAASGRAIGYNFLPTDNGWRRSGMSLDDGAYVGDAQAGVAWRKGDLQASFGYVGRTVKIDGLHNLPDARRQSMVAFTVSLKPVR